ncbi:hypothetical protein CYMTET_24622 [Cymbomonas tetramitiformis]|uniref:Uncharacterized protein n=1 Tax=Cymbomonas tetramitiformis TaxID=36881 RepID=A0AAE0KZW4_9CHLO|nr:hypothetical protein CYMTET_24622 [Cymbomonas tetramitiformis]
MELQALFIKSQANEWVDRPSWSRDLDDGRLNRRWPCCRLPVDWTGFDLLSDMSVELPLSPLCDLRDEKTQKLREEEAAAKVVAPH